MAAAPQAIHTPASAPERGLFADFLQRYAKNRVAIGAAIVLGLIMLSALLAPVISPHNPNLGHLLHTDHGPMPGHLLGTDDLGRDVLSRLIYGGRISISVGLVAAFISMVLGILIGSVAGYFGRWVDNVLMRCVDIVLSIPVFALLIVVAAIVQHPTVFTVMLVIGLVSWPGVARIVRGEFLTLRERDYIEAEKAEGATGSRIMWRHLLPNAMAPIIVSTALGVANAILTEAGLSFLGLGVQQPTPSWGNMLRSAFTWRAVVYYWWEWVPAGLAILITCVCIYVMGDALRDALDPRLRT